MPRKDWNTPTAHVQKPRHGRMGSASHGKGHDKKIRAAKRRADPRHLRRIFSKRKDDEPPAHR